MDERFTTLTEAITYVFQKEGASILSLDNICQGLAQPNLFLQTSAGLVLCSTISRKRVSSILSSSDIFARAGPPRSCMWSIKPSNPLCLSEGALLSCINQILTENGPLTVKDIIQQGDLTEATPAMIFEFLNSHTNKYQIQQNETWWFANQPLPKKWKFDSVVSALIKSFDELQHEASIEELNWLLCLSTLPQGKKISRRKISRELSRRPDLFQHISRAKYSLIATEKNVNNTNSILTISVDMNTTTNNCNNNTNNININNNSNNQFNFNCLNNFNNINNICNITNINSNDSSNSNSPQVFHVPYNQNNNFQPQLSQNISITSNAIPLPQIQPQVLLAQPQMQVQQIPQMQQAFQLHTDLLIEEFRPYGSDSLFEPSKIIDFSPDWTSLIPKCETPPMATDYFDPEEFFSVGFSATFE